MFLTTEAPSYITAKLRSCGRSGYLGDQRSGYGNRRGSHIAIHHFEVYKGIGNLNLAVFRVFCTSSDSGFSATLTVERWAVYRTYVLARRRHSSFSRSRD